MITLPGEENRLQAHANPPKKPGKTAKCLAGIIVVVDLSERPMAMPAI